jgi:hypothetical protein
VGSTAAGSGVAPQATINNTIASKATETHIHRMTLPFMVVLSSNLDLLFLSPTKPQI